MPAFERGMSARRRDRHHLEQRRADVREYDSGYDNAGQMLAQTELIFGMLCAAETNERMQARGEQVMPLLSAHRDKIRLDEKLSPA